MSMTLKKILYVITDILELYILSLTEFRYMFIEFIVTLPYILILIALKTNVLMEHLPDTVKSHIMCKLLNTKRKLRRSRETKKK